MTDPSPTQSVQDLLDVVSGWNDGGVAAAYVKLLYKAATEGYPVGVLPSAVEAEALSDYEATMCMSLDVAVQDVTRAREALQTPDPVVVEHGHRKGQATYVLNDAFIKSD